jgi:hypothetical protein
MQTYFAPEHKLSKYTCPHCQVVAKQTWHDLLYRGSNGAITTDQAMDFSVCTHCDKRCYWYAKKMIVPSMAPVETAHPDTPAGCREDYEEAREIVARSPRAAAALMRLVIQKLMPLLGEKGKNINEDIASLVVKGLPIEVQQALDFCRVIGNNGVHPGEIDLNDTPEVAHSLFSMVNFIVEDRISRPKKVTELYGKLPEAARAAIAKRDSTS